MRPREFHQYLNMQTIITKTLPATSTKPTRVMAKAAGGASVTISVHGSEDSASIHRSAAIQLVKRMNWAPVVLAEGGTKDGFAYVMLEPNHFLLIAELTDGRDLCYVENNEPEKEAEEKASRAVIVV